MSAERSEKGPVAAARLVDAPVHIEVIDTVERLMEIELAWDELYRTDPHAHLYLSCTFLSSIAIRTAGRFRILTAWADDGRCVGLLPLIVTTRWSKAAGRLTNVLDMLGHVFDADYTGILCDPAVETEVCRAFAEEISGMTFQRVVLNYFRGPTRRLDAFTEAFDPERFDRKANEHFINEGRTNNLLCPCIELPDRFSTYLAGLNPNTRQKLRRLLRQLDGDPALKLRSSRPETYAEDVTILSRLWYLRHAEEKGRKRASRLAELLKDAVLLGLASGLVHLTILWRAGKPIAAQANYVDWRRREALFHVAGRDDAVRDLSAGLLLHAHCIRWAIAHGLERYDFTIGNEPYKYSLGGVDREIRSAEVFTRSGTNTTDRLDPGCREDALAFIRRYAARGRDADARTALRQVEATWPELALDEELSALRSGAN
ncbi:MAG: GNAT family N-acetyltransferase [Pseudomonadales bacterium]|jgi:CelD/BcsL family acetyltransferase involved in cellulose biosynthesis|nr:GNAT family N-acetyltransferase [Pseudomonadales bacterium]